MVKFGIWLIILGVLALIYPLFGYQLRILSFLNGITYNIIAGIILGAGIVLIIAGLIKKKK